MHLTLSLLVLATLSLPCAAQADHWVDPVNGSDSALGTSPSTPLKTVTQALELADPFSTVFLYPGTYSQLTGDTFPLIVTPNVSVESIDGPDFTVLSASSGYDVIFMESNSSLTGVTIMGAGINLLLTRPATMPLPAVIRNCDFVGARRALWNSHVRVESSRFRGQTRTAIKPFVSSMTLVDCEITGSASTYGVRPVYTFWDNYSPLIELTRCRIEQCGRGALVPLIGYQSAQPEMRLNDCLLVNNPGPGVRVQYRTQPLAQNSEIVIEGSTIAGNGRWGVDNRGPAGSSGVDLRSCIIANNAIGDFIGIGTSEWSLVADGSAPAGVGNIAGDPRFVDSAAGDWSLRFDSPCVDTGDASLFRQDFAGRARTVDGDLNLAPRPDMGALEHATLAGGVSATVGQSFLLGVTGPDGGFSTVIVAPGGFASFGANTPFGRLFIQPQGSFRLQPVATTGAGPTFVDLSSQLDPAWIGTSVGLQALPRSTAAPAGGAYSNPLLVQIQ